MIVDFFVVGAARSGTTSIYRYLSLHPQIYLPNVKECNFFSRVESMDFEAYEPLEAGKQYHMKIIKSEDAYISLFKNAPSEVLKGEVSPSYLWDKNTAVRIYDHNPDAKIIISLRNPIHRAFSHYLMHLNTGYEKQKSFEKAIKANKVEIWGGGNLYLEMGMYYEQVKAYLEIFPTENIRILIYEDWIQNVEKCFKEVFEFLGVDTKEDISFGIKFNETVFLKNGTVLGFLRKKKIKKGLKKILSDEFIEKIKKNLFSDNTNKKEELKDEFYKELVSYYQSDISKLDELINLSLIEKWQLIND